MIINKLSNFLTKHPNEPRFLKAPLLPITISITKTMEVSYSLWFASSFLMRSNEDTMIAILKQSFTERQNTYPRQIMPWLSQVLPQEYAIGWWTINPTKQDRHLFPSILLQDHQIFRHNLSPEQNFLFSQLKSVLCTLADHGSDNKLVLANVQYRLSEGYTNTYILRVMDALFKLHEKYISSSLVGQRPTENVSANQELARGLSLERMYYGIQLPSTFRSFFCGKSQKSLSFSVHWISRYRGAPIVSLLSSLLPALAFFLILHLQIPCH